MSLTVKIIGCKQVVNKGIKENACQIVLYNIGFYPEGFFKWLLNGKICHFVSI